MIDYLKQRMLDMGTDEGYNDDMSKDPQKHPHPLFIAFSGKKQVGKDTAAQMVVEILQSAGKSVTITAFAEPLKGIAINILGIDSSLVYGSNEQKNTPTHILWDTMPLPIRWKYRLAWYRPLRIGSMTVREVLQVLGTDIFRKMFENDVWANAPFHKNWSQHDVVVLTDCRFPNEKFTTEKHGGIVIRLDRNTGYQDDHPSETALDFAAFTYRYRNDSSFENLKDFIRPILKKHQII